MSETKLGIAYYPGRRKPTEIRARQAGQRP